MRLTRNLAVFVTAVLVGQVNVDAQQHEMLSPAPQPSGVSGSPHFNGFSVYRAQPDLGAPGSAGHGFSHFMLPMDKYTNWYRPRAATLSQCQRCAPDSFRPRGLGHLFARPCDGFRMDYSPHVLSDGYTQYGPSYIARQPDPRCEDCDPTAQNHGH